MNDEKLNTLPTKPDLLLRAYTEHLDALGSGNHFSKVTYEMCEGIIDGLEIKFYVKKKDATITFEMEALIAKISEKNRAKVSSFLLSAQYLNLGTGGGVIWINDESRAAYLSNIVEVPTTTKILDHLLENTLNYTRFLQKEVMSNEFI